MTYIRTLLATLLVVAMMTFAVPANAATPAPSAVSSTVSPNIPVGPTNCADDHRTRVWKTHGNPHGTVWYRDCNNNVSRWFEIYAVSGSYNFHKHIPCGHLFLGSYLKYFKLTFNLTHNGGKSFTPWVKLPCKKTGHFRNTFNVDRLMGRTYPSGRSVGIDYYANWANARDKRKLIVFNLG